MTDFSHLNASTKPKASVEDERALHIMENSLRLQEGHFQVALLWRREPPNLPNSRTLAEKSGHAFNRSEQYLNRFKILLLSQHLLGANLRWISVPSRGSHRFSPA